MPSQNHPVFSQFAVELDKFIEINKSQITQVVQQMTTNFLQPIISPEFKKFLKETVDETQKTFDELDLMYRDIQPIFQEAGFWVTPSMRLVLLRDIKRLYKQEELTVDTLRHLVLNDYKADSWRLLCEMVKDWERNPLFRARIHIFRDALEAHIDGKYTLSIPTLLPHVEGIVRATVQWKAYKSSTHEAIAALYPTAPAILREALEAFVIDQVFQSIEFANFEEYLSREGHDPQHYLNRHSILHGVQINYASEENSLRAFLLLDTLSEVIRPGITHPPLNMSPPSTT